MQQRLALVGIGTVVLLACGWYIIPRHSDLLAPGVHLMLDTSAFESVEGVTRSVRTPIRAQTPVVTGTDDKCGSPYVTVLHDQGRFLMWYNERKTPPHFGIASMDSDDGVNWNRPAKTIYNPSRNLFCPVVTRTQDGYSMVWWDRSVRQSYLTADLKMSRPHRAGPQDGVEDIISVHYDTARQRHVLLCKRVLDGFTGKPPFGRNGTRRCVAQSESTDGMKTWTPLRTVIAPDAGDEGITEFYGIGGITQRGNTLVGMLRVLRDDLPCESSATTTNGTGYTVLAWSHDGLTWQRDREPFLARSPEHGAFDHAMAWADCQTPVGDDVYVYYGGYATGHKTDLDTGRSIGIAMMKRDRYTAVGSFGTVRTKPFRVEGPITLNADARGVAYARLVDSNGMAIDGFERADFGGDNVRHEPRWSKPLSSIRGKVVRLEIGLVDAKLYALTIGGQ